MIVQFYTRWDWEYDRGEEPLRSDALPESYAAAFYDHGGRLYRVTVRNNRAIVIPGGEDETEVFDYFCDDTGRILEKRSLDADGNVVLIVRFTYHNGNVSETGWAPMQGEPPRTFTRPLA